MILGLGHDLVDIRRIEASLKKFGSRFENRIFTAAERAKAQSSASPAATYAKRFAAKEACAKALGIGIQQGVYLRDMEVTNLTTGQPALTLHGGAAKRLAELLPAGMSARLHLSLSDEYPIASAHLIIEAV
jgi:holo-[acyl-carrier protein] synthase